MPTETVLLLIDVVIWILSIMVGYMTFRKMRAKYKRPLEKFKDTRPYLIGITVGFVTLGTLYLLVAGFIFWLSGG